MPQRVSVPIRHTPVSATPSCSYFVSLILMRLLLRTLFVYMFSLFSVRLATIDFFPRAYLNFVSMALLMCAPF